MGAAGAWARTVVKNCSEAMQCRLCGRSDSRRLGPPVPAISSFHLHALHSLAHPQLPSVPNFSSAPFTLQPPQELVSGDREPITPFICKLPPLAARGVSCVLVIGGSGQYFDVAGGWGGVGGRQGVVMCTEPTFLFSLADPMCPGLLPVQAP